MIWRGFVGPGYRMDSLPISAQRCINFYTERYEDPNTGSDYTLRPTPGYKYAFEIDDPDLPEGSFNRGNYRTSVGLGLTPDVGGSVITIVGPGVYWIQREYDYQNKEFIYTWEKLGVISNLSSRVRMVDDGFGLILADGANIYRLDLKTKQFNNVGFNLTNPTDVEFLNGYSIVIGQDENLPQNTFFWSNLYDNGSWDALNYGQAEISQDPITGIVTAGSYLYLFGPRSFELHTSTNDSEFPFKRAFTSSGSIGLYSRNSLVRFGNSVFFMGTNNEGAVSAYMGQGANMQKISTVALEKHWDSGNIEDCTAFTLSVDGHDWVVFNFDLMNETHVYDLKEAEWFELASRNETLDELFRWEPNFAVKFTDDILVGDRFSNKFYTLSSKYKTENGRNILRIRTASHQNSEQRIFRTDAVRFHITTGNGITDETPDRYTEAPVAMYRYSRDQGRTFSSRIRKGLGRTGEYGNGLEYTRHGSGRNYTGELSVSDSAAVSVLNAYLFHTIAQRSRRG